MGRQENVKIFEDTFALCSQNGTLRNAIEQSNEKQKLYPEGFECTEKHTTTYARPAKILVSSKRTLEAASSYAYAGKKVCIHSLSQADAGRQVVFCQHVDLRGTKSAREAQQ